MFVVDWLPEYSDERWAMLLPLVFVAGDIVVGFLRALGDSDLRSSVMREGLKRKLGEIVALAILYLASQALDISGLLYAVSSYLVLMEAISLCENLNSMGVRIPAFIRKALAKATEVVENGGESDSDEKR